MTNRTRTISVTSGKGGVGKTTIASNLAYFLADQGRRVLIFDGDMGMSNVELMLQVRPKGSISDVLSGVCSINDVVTEVSENIWLVSGGTGIDSLQNLDCFQRKHIIDSLSMIDTQFDDVVIDTSPGLNDNVLYLNSAACENVVVLTPEPTSFSDAYALIKVMNMRFKRDHFTILCNQVSGEREAMQLYQKFSDVVSKFLTVGLDFCGGVANDQFVRHSVSRQRLILKQFPDSKAAQGMVRTFGNLLENKILPEKRGGLELFWNQLVGVA